MDNEELRLNLCNCDIVTLINEAATHRKGVLMGAPLI